MEIHDSQRHQIIKNLISPLSKSVVDDAIRLWERLGVELILIIGEDGFDALFARALYLNSAAFPWRVADLPSSQADSRFAELKRNLKEQTPAQASETNSLLLVTFTNILASLIGEQLTTHILRLAWGVDFSNKIINRESLK